MKSKKNQADEAVTLQKPKNSLKANPEVVFIPEVISDKNLKIPVKSRPQKVLMQQNQKDDGTAVDAEFDELDETEFESQSEFNSENSAEHPLGLDPEVLLESEDEFKDDGEDGEHELDFIDEENLESPTPGLVSSSPLQRYLSEIRRYALLTREEEREIATKAFDHGDAVAKQRLVTSNLRLVVKIAMEYRRAYAQILDLIQEGNAGLVQAVNRFNPYRGVKLSTYSAWWIRAYILKFLMDNKSLVRMGTTDAQRKLFFRLRGEAEKLYAQTQKFDTLLLAEKLGVKETDVIEMHQRLTKSDMSLDQTIGDESDTKHIDILASGGDSVETTYEKSQMLKILREKIVEVEKELNERDLYIFHHRILADSPVTLQEVGEKYGVSRERARQLESRVLKKIKELFLEESDRMLGSIEY